MEVWKDDGRAADSGTGFQGMTPGPERIFDIDPKLLVLKNRINSEESGLGEVWVSTLKEPSGSHEVAVKRYPSAWMEQELTMFQRETAVLFMAAMRCHNVCKVYGTSVKDEKMCIVMKLYKESLAGLLRRSPHGKLSLDQTRRFGGEICKAVAELHEQNIILQDLKPPNILLDEYDHCVVADFGISKIVQGNIGVHMPSNVQGTFNYMSPEAFDPEQFGGISHKADAWSFACTLLEMLTGIKPWKGYKMAPIVRKVMNGEVPDVPQGLPPRVEQMLRRCFSFNPRDRPSFQSMYELFKTPWEVTPDPKQDNILAPFDVFGVFGGQQRPGSQAARPGSVDGDAGLGAVYRKAQEADEAKQEVAGLKMALQEQKSTLERVQQRLEEKTAECERTVSLLESKGGKADDELRKAREERETETAGLRERLAAAGEERQRERVEREALAAEKEMLGREKEEVERSKVALEVEVEELRRTIAERAESREAAKEEERGAEEALRRDRERLERERAGVEAEREALQEERKRIEREKAHTSTQVESLEKERRERNEEVRGLREELESVYADKNNWKSESRALQNSKRECEGLQKRLADLTEQSARLSDVMEKSSKELRKLYGEREQWKKDGAAHLASQEALEKRVEKADAQVARLGAELRQMEGARVKKTEEHDDEKQRMQAAFDKQKMDLDRKIDDLETALKAARESSESSAQEAAQLTLLQSRLRHTEEQNARLGSELRQGETARKALAEELENEKEKAARQTETMQTLLSEAEEESGRLGQELRQQESARLVLLEEFETEKQKLQTEFDRRQLALERKVQELEISAEKARQSSWNKRDLWSSADDDDERSTRRADRPSIAAADFSSPPIAPGGVADGQARVVQGPVEQGGHASEDSEQWMSKQDAEEMLRIANRIRLEGRAGIADTLVQMAQRSQKGQVDGVDEAPLVRDARHHVPHNGAHYAEDDHRTSLSSRGFSTATTPTSPTAPPRSNTFLPKYTTPPVPEQSSRPQPVPSPSLYPTPSPSLRPSSSPAARNPPTPGPNGGGPPSYPPATPVRSLPPHLAVDVHNDNGNTLKSPSSASELVSPSSNRHSTGQPRVLAISRARAGMDQQGDSPSATANHAPQPPPRLTVVPAAKAEANGGSTSGIRGSFDERVLSGSQASSGRGLLQDRVSEDSERREGEMRGNTSPVRAERRGGLGLMLEGDKITKIIAGSKCHRAGLKVGDVVRKVNGELVHKSDVSNKLRRGLHEASSGMLHVGVLRDRNDGGAGQLLDFTIEVENDESESKRMAGQHQNGRMEGRRDEPVGLIGHHFVPQGEQSPRPRYAGQYNGTPTTPRPQGHGVVPRGVSQVQVQDATDDAGVVC